MLLRLFFLVLLGFSTATSGFSQEPDKILKIRRLMKLTGASELGNQVLKQMMPSLKQLSTDVPEEFWSKLLKEIDPEELVNLVIPIYDKHFTEEEIVKLIIFYESPLGKKLVSVMPVLLQESMTAGQAWGEQIGRRVAQKMIEKGYLKE